MPLLGLPILLVVVFVMGAQFYYPFGLLAVLFAIGCVPAEAWLVGRRRRRVAVAAVAANAAVSLALGLPVIPLNALGATPIPAINQVAQDTIGWPTYVRQVADEYANLPAPDRRRTVIIASNYGEAGAVDRYGDRYHLPAVYSGLNQLYYQRQPPASATGAVFVGGQLGRARSRLRSCVVADHLDNGVGVDNEEQGEPIAVCRCPIGGWPVVWPALTKAELRRPRPVTWGAAQLEREGQRQFRPHDPFGYSRLFRGSPDCSEPGR